MKKVLFSLAFLLIASDSEGRVDAQKTQIRKIERVQTSVLSSVSRSHFEVSTDRLRGPVSMELRVPNRVKPPLREKFERATLKPQSVGVVRQYVFPDVQRLSAGEFEGEMSNLFQGVSSYGNQKLESFSALTDDEFRFWGARYLAEVDDNCSAAMSIFHSLSETEGFDIASNYYLAQCSFNENILSDYFDRTLKVIKTRDPEFSVLSLEKLPDNIPVEFLEEYGLYLAKLSNSRVVRESLSAEAFGKLVYLVAQYTFEIERFDLTIRSVEIMSESHSLYPYALMLKALSYHGQSQGEQSRSVLLDLVKRFENRSRYSRVVSLAHLNLARISFQEGEMTESVRHYHKIDKNQPFWFQSLKEMGWAQLQSDDLEGAIGNMYSVQTPFFRDTYKPESYVIRTIGYLNLCQFGDAYHTLTNLEREYRSHEKAVSDFQRAGHDLYEDVASWLTEPEGDDFILPVSILKEVARGRGFTRLQRSINRMLNEKSILSGINDEVRLGLGRSRRRVEELRLEIAQKREEVLAERSGDRPSERRINRLVDELDSLTSALNLSFFYVNIYDQAVHAFPVFSQEVVEPFSGRSLHLANRAKDFLNKRLEIVKKDIERILNNNEFLRYEVFSGSGEDIRFHMAGGNVGNRIPADIIPQNQSLRFRANQEIWHDEVGYYRSTLKNNCPEYRNEGMRLSGGGIGL